MEQFQILNRTTERGFKFVNVFFNGELHRLDQSDVKQFFIEADPESISEFKEAVNKGQCYGCELSREDAVNMLVDEQFNDDELVKKVAKYFLTDYPNRKV